MTGERDALKGGVVTVHGHFAADGQMLATLVEPHLGEPLYLVRGVIQELAPNRFAIGDLDSTPLVAREVVVCTPEFR